MKNSSRETNSGSTSRLDSEAVDALAERLEFASSALGKRITTACASSASTLTPAQYHLLAMLGTEQGGCRVTELAEKGGVQPSAITAIVDRLVERGLLSRERDPHDRRVVRVSATPAGLDQVRCAHQAVRDYLRPLLAQLEPDELEGLIHAMEKLWRLAEDSAEEN